MNLLQETITTLQEYDKTIEDILFIVVDDNSNFRVNAEQLSKILNVEYFAGFGAVEINDSLKLVGSNFWLERHEYDGSEWWEYKTLPIYDHKKGISLSDIPIKMDYELGKYSW